jgi:D-threonate/D-erythronate kinase
MRGVRKGWVLAIADDLTGALEVGARFAGSVVTTELTVSARPDVGVLVIDTETRHLPADAAAGIVRETVSAALRFDPWLIYKKTDSTLRGNIAAEFRALLQVAPERSLIYAPAYPEMGRTVRNGQLFVHGIPVHQSEFAADPLNPVRCSDLAELLAGIPLSLQDGETVGDLAEIAREVVERDPPPLAAGPAALAGALAAHLQRGRNVFALPNVSRCLVINGSMNPVSVGQIEFARAHGCFDDRWICFDGTGEGEGLERAARTGEKVRQILQESQIEALVIFGGDTAFGIHRALGSHDFRPCGEVAPGVPISRCGDLFWITKAGGFGPPDVLCDIRRRLI